MLLNLNILKAGIAIPVYVTISQVIDFHAMEPSLVRMEERFILGKVRVVCCLMDYNDEFLRRRRVNGNSGSGDDWKVTPPHAGNSPV
jgi:hypothetical protein